MCFNVLSPCCMVIASTFIGEFLCKVFFMCDRLPLWLPIVSVDCLCIVLYDVLYINVEPWISQDITKQQFMYVCITLFCWVPPYSDFNGDAILK